MWSVLEMSPGLVAQDCCGLSKVIINYNFVIIQHHIPHPILANKKLC